jgi:hypothetical protein
MEKKERKIRKITAKTMDPTLIERMKRNTTMESTIKRYFGARKNDCNFGNDEFFENVKAMGKLFARNSYWKTEISSILTIGDAVTGCWEIVATAQNFPVLG